jgi:hypothetical protein
LIDVERSFGSLRNWCAGKDRRSRGRDCVGPAAGCEQKDEQCDRYDMVSRQTVLLHGDNDDAGLVSLRRCRISSESLMAPGSCFAIFGAIRFLQTARKPNSVLDDHSSRRRITAALEQPTRGFRLPSSFRSQAPFALAHRASTPLPREGLRRSPCLFGLAPCGVYIAATVTRRAVRSYRTFSPLPLLATYVARRGGMFSVALAVRMA